LYKTQLLCTLQHTKAALFSVRCWKCVLALNGPSHTHWLWVNLGSAEIVHATEMTGTLSSWKWLFRQWSVHGTFVLFRGPWRALYHLQCFS
jgi:hypothetical protein